MYTITKLSTKLSAIIALCLLAVNVSYAHGHRGGTLMQSPFNNVNTASAMAVTCNVSMAALNFGEYHNQARQDVKTQVPISILCSGASDVQVNYTVTLTQGTSGNYLSRTLQNSTTPNQKLVYNLFIDPTLKTVWGDGNQGTGVLSGICTSNTTCTQTVYAYIPAHQIAAHVGQYYDDISATISYH